MKRKYSESAPLVPEATRTSHFVGPFPPSPRGDASSGSNKRLQGDDGRKKRKNNPRFEWTKRPELHEAFLRAIYLLGNKASPRKILTTMEQLQVDTASLTLRQVASHWQKHVEKKRQEGKSPIPDDIDLSFLKEAALKPAFKYISNQPTGNTLSTSTSSTTAINNSTACTDNETKANPMKSIEPPLNTSTTTTTTTPPTTEAPTTSQSQAASNPFQHLPPLLEVKSELDFFSFPFYDCTTSFDAEIQQITDVLRWDRFQNHSLFETYYSSSPLLIFE